MFVQCMYCYTESLVHLWTVEFCGRMSFDIKIEKEKVK